MDFTLDSILAVEFSKIKGDDENDYEPILYYPYVNINDAREDIERLGFVHRPPYGYSVKDGYRVDIWTRPGFARLPKTFEELKTELEEAEKDSD